MQESVPNVYRQIVWIYADIGNNIKIHGSEKDVVIQIFVGNVSWTGIFRRTINFLFVITYRG